MTDAYPVLKKGSPELLQTAFSLIVPEGSNPETEILDAQFTEVQQFALAPSKGKLYRNVNPDNIAYTENPDYQISNYLLGSAVEMGDSYQLRDFQGMNFKVYPFDYNPVAQKLKIYSSVTVKVTFNSTRSVAAATKINRTFDAVYANQFLNYRGFRGDGSKFEGEYINDKINGFGIYYNKYGRKVYEGYWKEGKREGIGIYYCEDGASYEGEWKENLKYGIGVYKFNDNSRYLGEFKNDVRNGIGVIHGGNSDKYEGEWMNDQGNGFGTYYYNKGEVYVGNWKNGLRDGYNKTILRR